ncbi:MAG TPA: hypothetical protein VGG64_16175 [Pirellulales bacterium]|jgi:hypothetical protein
MLYRQGDIFIESVPSIPPGAAKQPDLVLAEGEATGHRHRVDDSCCSADLFAHQGQLYLSVLTDEAMVIHDEHDTIVLTRGKYRIWRQREYDPNVRKMRRVVFD